MVPPTSSPIGAAVRHKSPRRCVAKRRSSSIPVLLRPDRSSLACAMSLPRPAYASVLLLALACGGDGSSDEDSGMASADAAPPSCEERRPLTIGHCIEADTGFPCVSGESEMQLFRALDDSDEIHPIIGLQGSPMFVLAVQGQDIALGQDLDAPRVNLRVFDGEQDVGGFSARPIVSESPDTPGLVTAPRLFVVSFFAEDLVGKTLDVTAEVEDRLGQSYCATNSFVAGELLEGEPIH